MSNQSLREAAQQALECKRLADNYAGACAGCDPGEFATKERDELHVAIDKLTALAQHETGATCDHDTAQPVAEVYRGHYGGRNGSVGFDGVRPLRGAKLPPPGTKLYAAPQPPAEQEPKRPENCGTNYCSCIECPHDQGAAKAREDREQAAFEEWAHETSPSGDVESVQRQWEESYALADFLEEEAKREQGAELSDEQIKEDEALMRDALEVLEDSHANHNAMYASTRSRLRQRLEAKK